MTEYDSYPEPSSMRSAAMRKCLFSSLFEGGSGRCRWTPESSLAPYLPRGVALHSIGQAFSEIGAQRRFPADISRGRVDKAGVEGFELGKLSVSCGPSSKEYC